MGAATTSQPSPRTRRSVGAAAIISAEQAYYLGESSGAGRRIAASASRSSCSSAIPPPARDQSIRSAAIRIKPQASAVDDVGRPRMRSRSGTSRRSQRAATARRRHRTPLADGGTSRAAGAAGCRELLALGRRRGFFEHRMTRAQIGRFMSPIALRGYRSSRLRFRRPALFQRDSSSAMKPVALPVRRTYISPRYPFDGQSLSERGGQMPSPSKRSAQVSPIFQGLGLPRLPSARLQRCSGH